MLRVRAMFPITIVMFLVSCAMEPETEVSSQESTEIDDAAPAAAGCVVVTTCNAPGPDGTRCRQQGCSLGAARLECELEASSVCGTAICPVILIRTDGTRENLCQSGLL
jgi:hypothetical protein